MLHKFLNREEIRYLKYQILLQCFWTIMTYFSVNELLDLWFWTIFWISWWKLFTTTTIRLLANNRFRALRAITMQHKYLCTKPCSKQPITSEVLLISCWWDQPLALAAAYTMTRRPAKTLETWYEVLLRQERGKKTHNNPNTYRIICCKQHKMQNSIKLDAHHTKL